MIDRLDFAYECVRQGLYAGDNPHYLLGVAELRSGITDGAVGGQTGPFRLTQAEWDAHREDSAFGLDFLPTDITNWRFQIAVFAHMLRRAFEAFRAANDRTPSAVELYRQQFPSAATPTLAADLQRALDATAELVVHADIEVLSDLPDETLIEQIGVRATAIKSQPDSAAGIGSQASYLVAPATSGLLHVVKKFGRAVLIEWTKQLHKLVCGDDPVSAEDRSKLRDAFGIGQTTGAVLLTSGLVEIGCPLALATVIAAIIMRRFVGSAVDVFCLKSRAWIDGLS